MYAPPQKHSPFSPDVKSQLSENHPTQTDIKWQNSLSVDNDKINLGQFGPGSRRCSFRSRVRFWWPLSAGPVSAVGTVSRECRIAANWI